MPDSLRELAEKANDGIGWYTKAFFSDVPRVGEDAEFIAAVSPERVLEMLRDRDELIGLARCVSVQGCDCDDGSCNACLAVELLARLDAP